MSKSLFNDKRIHSIDQKSGKTALTCVGLSEIEKKDYEQKLRQFSAKLLYKYPDLDSQLVYHIMDDLFSSCDTFQEHQIIWATNLHIFPSGFLPPIKVPNNFSLEDLRPEFIEFVHKARVTIYRISDFLYDQNIPQINPDNPLPEEALNLFSNSEIQKIIGESEY